MSTQRPEAVVPELCRGFILSITTKTYTTRDAIIYALGLGVSDDPMDVQDLKFTYENADGFAALPTYAVVIPPIESIFDGLLSCPGMPDFNPMMLLHGEEKIQILKPIPFEATVECTSRITDVLDKGKGAVVSISSEMFVVDPSKKKSDEPMCLVDMSVFIRGIGGFGGPRGVKTASPAKPSGTPDLVVRRSPHSNQAILYRLSGDTNPLHIDPKLAAMGGFDRPILHGLCTYGIAAHTLVKHVGSNDAFCLKSIEGRFSAPVIPGNELSVQIWVTGENEVIFNVEDLTTKQICLSDGKAVFNVPIKLEKVEGDSSL